MKNLLKYAGFGIGTLGMDLSYGLFFTFLNYYLTDTLFLHPIFLMVLTTAARVWDGVNDPIMGTIVDGTRSRLGKYRFWLMIGASANAVVLALLFTNPGFTVTKDASVIDLGLCIYVAVMYILWDMTNTVMDIPFWSMVPSLTTDPKQRNLAATVPRAFSGLGQLVVGAATPILVPLLGRGEGYNAPGYRNWAVICGAALVGLMAISFLSTGKIPAITQAGPSQEKITFRAAWNTVKNNDQLLVFMLVALLMNTGWYMLTGLATHYFERVVGDGKQQSLFTILVGAGQAAGLLLLPVLTKWLKRNTVIKLAMGMAGIGYLGMYACRENFAAFAVFCLIGMVGVGSSFVGQTVMLSDIVDYGGHKLGCRSESVTFSMKGIIQKGAYSVQAVAMFLMIHLSGYDAALAVQPQSAKTAITVMMLLVPPALTAAALWVFSRKYKLDEERMKEING
ncbi:MAG: glycoside-pentoside-hexuronide (GPH):cation symporter [Firmicutes bacterium]|nr:glycoside-pentoside-hexuronide (GPH):cation symporter [Bacillota bacterium]